MKAKIDIMPVVQVTMDAVGKRQHDIQSLIDTVMELDVTVIVVNCGENPYKHTASMLTAILGAFGKRHIHMSARRIKGDSKRIVLFKN